MAAVRVPLGSLPSVPRGRGEEGRGGREEGEHTIVFKIT